MAAHRTTKKGVHMAQNKEPAKTIRLGRIEATVWPNRNRKGETWFHVEIKRHYIIDGKWHASTIFGRDDLPIIAKAADMAYAWIWRQSVARSSAPIKEKL